MNSFLLSDITLKMPEYEVLPVQGKRKRILYIVDLILTIKQLFLFSKMWITRIQKKYKE